MATSTFSLFFPPLPSSKGQWPVAEEAAYSYDDHSTVTTLSPSSPASSASSGSLVDCTLSLGMPSSRRPQPDRRPPPQAYPSVSAAAEPCYYHQQHGGRGGAAGHEQLLDRRCANCGTASTPLWRNGPRGPKSLCNACGIRFKKEERRAAETNGGGGCGYVAQRAPMSAPRAVPYAEEALPYAGVARQAARRVPVQLA
ncbi:GATA transcription factor 15-like isoform X2 [Hordeum vulgare subsp. vulgare]|uniref:GATA transcription factor 15-like isoform X2 n=1 Tax=Hordeum vulgare subsp. vulgare TaxID=112509 RepID=UPI001D1A4C57|nr:GATA transcription factor 15-like isoform X2 [Hordeum vulgare subsp. vulgare]